MFFNPMGPSNLFPVLLSFISALHSSDFPAGTPRLWDFSKWITAVVDGISKNLPWDWLLERLGPDEAFEEYFRYLDDYRRCREIELLCIEDMPLLPRLIEVH